MLTAHKHTLASGAVVNARMYYYILDALETNPERAEFIRRACNFEKVNELNAETFNLVFTLLVKLEMTNL